MRCGLGRICLVTFYGLALIGGGVVLFFFAPEHSSFYPRCTLFVLTGFQCPGCGGLRAVHHLLHGQWLEALQLNPLVFLVGPIGLAALVLHSYQLVSGRAAWQPFRHPGWLWAILAFCVIFALARNLLRLFASHLVG